MYTSPHRRAVKLRKRPEFVACDRRIDGIAEWIYRAGKGGLGRAFRGASGSAANSSAPTFTSLG
jgi:hypothetical protein